MAKLTLEELKKKYNEKIVDNDDLVIELNPYENDII